MQLSKEQLVISVGRTLRELRISRNKSIEQLANETCIGYAHLSRIERGKINTSIYHVYTILQYLKVPPLIVIKTFLKTMRINE